MNKTLDPKDYKTQLSILQNILTINGIVDPLAQACLSDLYKKLQELDKCKSEIVALKDQLKSIKADYNDLQSSRRRKTEEVK